MEIPPPASNRTNRFMIEGVGSRVIRGPDWKWGKQVSHTEFPAQKADRSFLHFLVPNS